MKNKKRVVLIALTVALILALIVGCGISYLADHNVSASTGRYLLTSTGAHMILLDDSPIKMSNCSDNEELFADLQTGDLIQILHDGIEESYPGGTGVYYLKKLEDGSIEDIPNEIIETLSTMGWIPVNDEGKTREIYTGVVISYDPVYQDKGNYIMKINTESGFTEEVTLAVVQSTEVQAIDDILPGDRIWAECTEEGSGYKEVTQLIEYQIVSYEYGYANMSLELPAGWAYEIRGYEEESDTFGIDFWPEGQEGKIQLNYYIGGFGVCGTGLEEEQIRLTNGLRAIQGIYDNRSIWTYIAVRDLPGSYVFRTEMVDAWWEEHGSQAMDIIQSAVLAKDILWANGAQNIAERETKGEYEFYRADFDFCEGMWTVQLRDSKNQDIQYTVIIDSDGNVVSSSIFDPDGALAAKPVIYLYPEEEQTVTVKLDFDGELTVVYPAYQDGWTVMAGPDGTLTDPETGREYYCLFWEGISQNDYDFSEGFVIPGDETQEFLENALSQLGLTDREANEFIIYWLPQMEHNKYNLISFQQEAYTDSAVLSIDPQPDTLIRVFMAWKPLDALISVPEQSFVTPKRTGFTAVEWGGAKVG